MSVGHEMERRMARDEGQHMELLALRARVAELEAERDRYKHAVDNVAFVVEDEHGRPTIPQDVYRPVMDSILRAWRLLPATDDTEGK